MADAFRLKNVSEQTGKEEKCKVGGGSVGKRKLFLKENLKGNLTGLIYKKGDKDKGKLAKMKVRPISKIFKDFTPEDDLSIEDN